MDTELQKSLDDTFKEWQMMELDYKNHIIEQKNKEIYQKMYGILYLLTFVYLYKKTYGLDISYSHDGIKINTNQISKDKFNELVIRHNILFNYYFIMVLIGFSILKNK